MVVLYTALMVGRLKHLVYSVLLPALKRVVSKSPVLVSPLACRLKHDGSLQSIVLGDGSAEVVMIYG
jgi:hypothetical protein